MDLTKIHPTLLNEINLSARGGVGEEGIEEHTYPVIVRLSGARGGEVSILEETGSMLRVERQIDMIQAVAGVATRAEVEALSESPSVEYLWYDEPVYALLDQALPVVEVAPVWGRGNRGAGVTICIVDTGVDADHPDLEGRVAARQDFTGEGVGDGHGHGTHVASIAAGNGAASGGRFSGVAPEATVLSARVLKSDGSGRMSYVLAGVEWAVEQGAQVINLSLGSRGACDGTDAASTIADAAVNAGVVVVAAAGNDGPAAGTIGSPGCARLAITVGATNNVPGIADFSSRGPTLDGRNKPDVVFPGDGIVAARASGTAMGRPFDDSYTRASGTSMATPVASGLAALMLAANPELTPTQLRDLMVQAARSLDLDPNTQGAGLVICSRAVALAEQGRPTPPPPPPPTQPEPPADPPTVPTEPPGEGCFAPVVRMFRRGG